MAVSSGPHQSLAESGCLIHMCWAQECLQTLTLHLTVYKTPSQLLSHLTRPTTLAGRSFNPILQMRKLWLRARGSDLPKVTELKPGSQGSKLTLALPPVEVSPPSFCEDSEGTEGILSW